jgi:hypothetical protein
MITRSAHITEYSQFGPRLGARDRFHVQVGGEFLWTGSLQTALQMVWEGWQAPATKVLDTTCTGVLFTARNGATLQDAIHSVAYPVSIVMPCGETFTLATANDVPDHDLPCPCGNPRHWLVRLVEDVTPPDSARRLLDAMSGGTETMAQAARRDPPHSNGPDPMETHLL